LTSNLPRFAVRLGWVSSRLGSARAGGLFYVYDPRFTNHDPTCGARCKFLYVVVSTTKGHPPSLQCTVAIISSRLFSSTYPCLSLADILNVLTGSSPPPSQMVQLSIHLASAFALSRARVQKFRADRVQAVPYPLGLPFYRYNTIHLPSLYQTHHSTDCKVTRSSCPLSCDTVDI
jgi:hypothetical protein